MREHRRRLTICGRRRNVIPHLPLEMVVVVVGDCGLAERVAGMDSERAPNATLAGPSGAELCRRTSWSAAFSLCLEMEIPWCLDGIVGLIAGLAVRGGSSVSASVAKL